MLFGADPFALVELARDLDDAARTITVARRAIAEALAGVDVAAEAVGRLDDLIAWLQFERRDLARRADELAGNSAAAPMAMPSPFVAGGLWWLPQRWSAECEDLQPKIEERTNELKLRMEQAEEDKLNLRESRPDGRFSYAGHLDKIEQSQKNLRKLLDLWDMNGCGPGGGGGGELPAGVRAWATADLVARLPKPIAMTPPPAEHHHHGFNWGDALKAVGVVAAGTVVAAGVVLAPEITVPALALGGGAAAAA